MREYRTLKVSGLRTEQSEDGKQYLTGYAANYNVLSRNLGLFSEWFERIKPGAFKRAVDEKQDVMHLINHDPSQILGRTKSGTTVLTDDDKGLAFRTLINSKDPAAVAFAERVSRGDIDQCSFGFEAIKSEWVEEADPDNPTFKRTVRELQDVNLYDVSTVTYPAYPETNTTLAALRSDGTRVPAEIRARLEKRDPQDGDYCKCDCMACYDGECEDCMNEDCVDPNCRCWMRAFTGTRADGKKTKRVDGEDLTHDCFLIVGDENDPSTWKLPWKFSSEEKTKSHLRNALARFNQLKGVSDEQKKSAWNKLKSLCKEHGVNVAEEDKLRSRLTPRQLADLSEPEYRLTPEAALAYAEALKLQTNL